jgi:ubiquinone/menaquinone biosynthesis C-methylase UbiE
MTEQEFCSPVQPGGLWSTSIARGLIRECATYSTDCTDAGFIDLLPPAPPPSPTLAQRAMQSKTVAACYERLWRPVEVAALSLHGLSETAERDRAAAALRITEATRVLDVACGPGNFTNYFARRLSGESVAIGIDNSAAMLAQAARTNADRRAVYIRADAHVLPFDDDTFDAVCCFAALYLIPDPIAALREMIRVLAPGGWIAISTSYGRETPIARHALRLGARVCGVRIFDRDAIPGYFAEAGLGEIDQQLRGITQFVAAHRPAGNGRN